MLSELVYSTYMDIEFIPYTMLRFCGVWVITVIILAYKNNRNVNLHKTIHIVLISILTDIGQDDILQTVDKVFYGERVTIP